MWLVRKAKLPITLYWSAEIQARDIEVNVWGKWSFGWFGSIEIVRNVFRVALGTTVADILERIKGMLKGIGR